MWLLADAVPPELTGPFALTVGLIVGFGYVVRLLVSFIRETITDLRAERDAWKALAIASEKDIGTLTAVIEPLLHVKVPDS